MQGVSILIPTWRGRGQLNRRDVRPGEAVLLKDDPGGPMQRLQGKPQLLELGRASRIRVRLKQFYGRCGEAGLPKHLRHVRRQVAEAACRVMRDVMCDSSQ